MPSLLYNNAFAKDYTYQLQNISDLKGIYNADSFINHTIERKATNLMIIIVPTGRIVQYLKNKYIRKYFDKYQEPCTPPKIFTFNSFIEYCYSKIFNVEKKTIPDAFVYALIEEAIKKSDLEYFKKQENNQISFNIVTKIARIILGLKEDGITPEDLFQDVANYKPVDYIDYNTGGVKDPIKLKDFATIYHNYQQLISDKLLDSAQFLFELNDFLRKNRIEAFDKIFEKDSTILFDKFSEFKKPQLDFLKEISRSFTPIAINVDYSPINGPLFGNLKETIDILAPEFYQSITYIDKNESMPVEKEITLPPSQYLRRRLFNNEDFENINYTKLQDTIKVIACENQVEEVSLIAKLVHYLVGIGYKPSDIAIVSRKPDLYSHLFREIFANNKIDAFISDRYDLSSSQLVILILNILDLVLNNFRKKELKKVLQSSYITHWANKEINRQNLLEVIKEIPYIGNFRTIESNFWIRVIQENINFLNNKLKNETVDDDLESLDIKKKINRYEQALNDISILTNTLNIKNAEYYPHEIVMLIKRDIIHKLYIKEQLENIFNELKEKKLVLSKLDYQLLANEIERDLLALTHFIKLTEEFAEIYTILNPEQKIKLSEFVNKIKIIVLNTKYQISESADRGVKITSVEQIVGIPYKVLILCGAVDGDFPLTFRTDNILGKILPKSESRHIEYEKILFYKMLTNNVELLDKGEFKFYITYPEYSNKEENIKSAFINELFNVTSLNNPDNSKFYRLSLLKKIGEKGFQDENATRQITELPFLHYITERSELIRKIASGKLYFDNQEEYLPNDKMSEAKYYYASVEDEKIVFNENLSENLKKYLQRYQSKVYSVTELETYPKCPYLYFIKYVLKISERTEDITEISNLEIGNLLHKIVYKFFTQFKDGDKEKKSNYIKLNHKKKEYYLEVLCNIAEQEILYYKNFDYEYSVLRKTIIGDNRDGLLMFWLERELEYQKDDAKFYPAFFELSFGDKRRELGLELDNGVKIRGKIDRIDLSRKGDRFLVIDYKKSKYSVPYLDDLIDGKTCQIPIYIEAAKKILPKMLQKKSIKPAGGAYFLFTPDKELSNILSKTTKPFLLLKDYMFFFDEKGENKYISNLVDEPALETEIRHTLKVTKENVEKIANGEFSLKNDLNCVKNPMNKCKFSNICKINSRQLWAEDNEEED